MNLIHKHLDFIFVILLDICLKYMIPTDITETKHIIIFFIWWGILLYIIMKIIYLITLNINNEKR